MTNSSFFLKFIFLLLINVSLSAQYVSIDMLGDLSYITDPRFSPDGEQVIYSVRTSDFEENKYVREVYLYNIKSGATRALTLDRTDARMARWTPEGRSILFLSEGANGRTQVFELSLLSGEAQQLTNAATGVRTYKMSPAGDLLAYVSQDPEPQPPADHPHLKSFEVGYDWYLAQEAARPSHIWICDRDGTDVYRLTSGAEGYAGISGEMDWSPDGGKIVYGAQPEPHSSVYLKTKLKTIDLTKGHITTLDGSNKVPRHPAYTSDGSIVYSKCLGAEFYFKPHGLHRFSTNKLGAAKAFDIDRNILYHRSLPDGSLVASGADGTKIVKWHVQPDGSYEVIGTQGILSSESNYDVSADGKMIFVGSTSTSPEELYLMDDLQSVPRKITNYNEALATLKYGKVEPIHWQNDGFAEDGVLTYPPDYQPGKKYPLVLYIHGGPMGKSLEGYNFNAQCFATEGWLVFQPNYRGSSNLGQEYQSAVINDAGHGPGRDVMAGIQKLKSMGIVDEGNIGVSGWSYGGYMTAWLTSHYDGWKAAVAGAAVTDWFDWYSMADWNVWSGSGLGGSPWLNDNAENYRKQSPITYCHHIKTPTLILSNTFDERVTVTQSYKYWSCLMDNEVETKFIAYPLPSHFPKDPVHRQDVYRRWTEWLREHFD